MILDKLIQNVRSEIVDLSWALQTDPFRKRLTTFSVDLLRSTVCSFLCDFIALEIMESELAFHDDNFCKFHVPHILVPRAYDPFGLQQESRALGATILK